MKTRRPSSARWKPTSSEVGNLNDRLQVLVAHRQLRGIAARQNKPYGPTDTCVAHLWQRLRASFGTEDNYSERLAKFTSSHFSYRDALDVYVSKQQRLHRRLFSGGSEKQLIKELIKQCRPTSGPPWP